MEIRKYPVNERITIEVKAHGNLNLEGSEGPDLEIAADSNTLKIERIGERLEILCFSDCMMKVPTVSKVMVDQVGGSAAALNFPQDFRIRKIGGDFHGENLGSAYVEKVGGGVKLRQVAGTAEIEKIGGDFEGQAIGTLIVRKTGGDLRGEANTIRGEFRAGGDIRLAVNELGPENIQMKAGGDLYLRLPAEVSVILSVRSDGEHIRIQLGDQVANIDERNFQGVFGENGPTLVLDAGGTVAVGDPATKEFEDVDFDFSDEFDWDFQFDLGPGFERLNRQARHIAAHSERIAEAANRRAEAAVRHAEIRVERTIRRMERRAPGQVVNFTPPPVPPVSPNPSDPAGERSRRSVSDEERLTVLRMLQEKKITLEQAEKLLAVLEGRSD